LLILIVPAGLAAYLGAGTTVLVRHRHSPDAKSGVQR
jgi:hypothetical protein